MIKEFFLDKFEYDFQCNRVWSNLCEANEDQLSYFIHWSMSHLINAHHRWISRLENVEPESELNDKLPLHHWVKLAQDNFQRTVEFLENKELNEKILYHDSEGVPIEKEVIDILYHILNHSNYHRAQVSKELRSLDITPPSVNFIAYH